MDLDSSEEREGNMHFWSMETRDWSLSFNKNGVNIWWRQTNTVDYRKYFTPEFSQYYIYATYAFV